MPATDSPAIIVARFLKANQFNDTLDALIREAGLPPDAGTVGKGDLTIERILDEKKVFDLSLHLEKVNVSKGEGGWSQAAPLRPTRISTLPSASNILYVSVDVFKKGSFPQCVQQMLFITTANRRLHILGTDSTFSLQKSMDYLQDSSILCCVPLSEQSLITVSCGMSGQVVLYDHGQDMVLEERRDHKKYVVKITIKQSLDVTWIATAGWDGKIFLYKIVRDAELRLGSPVATIDLPTNPEAIAFVDHPDIEEPLLLVTRRDSTSMHYYSLPTKEEAFLPLSNPEQLKLLGSQNLAPYSNAWIAFSPSSVAVCPTDPTLLAVATSSVPHMKLIIVRLFVPTANIVANPTNQAAQTRANLAIQDREDTAIQVHVSTLAPQTPYSTPQVVWRPDGSGVWVNGDDGVVRGVEAKTGKIIATLKNGHDMGSKIRSIWCGVVLLENGEEEEWVVSGGFDQRVIVWKPEE